ncbi:MAG: hypothetical protein MJ172_06490 [Clostridia bacterium]|nr:hypothetical protein [Clostridia bacterium]
MERSNLGISVGLLGAFLCFAALGGGYIPAVIIAGYILMREGNMWLRTLAIRVIALMVVVTAVVTLINLIPDCWGWIGSWARLFEVDDFPQYKLNSLIGIITSIINICKTILLLCLGFKALKGSTIKLPVVDGMVSKSM